MKSMKKWISVLSASALVLSMSVFAACSVVSSDGTISGNYREAEDADIQQLLTSLGNDNLFGDMDAEDWKYGLHGESSLDFSMSQDTYTASAGIDADLGILFAAGESGVDFSAGGSLDLKVEAQADGQTSSLNLGIEPYVDGEYIYLNMSGSESTGSGESTINQRGKIAYGGLGLTLPDLEELPSILATIFGNGSDPASFRAGLDAYGVDMDVDTSSGIKARFVFSADGVDDAIKEALGSLSTVDTSSYVVNLSESTLEFYLSIAEDGSLSAMSMRVDVAATIPEPKFDYGSSQAAEDAGALTIGMSGMLAVVSDDADIVFPTDLSSYEEIEIPLIPGLGL